MASDVIIEDTIEEDPIYMDDPQEPEEQYVEEDEQEPEQEPAQEPEQEQEQEPAQEPEQEPEQEPAQEPYQEPEQEQNNENVIEENPNPSEAGQTTEEITQGKLDTLMNVITFNTGIIVGFFLFKAVLIW